MPDTKTLQIGDVCIGKTYDNIKRSKKATFLAAKPTDLLYWEHYEKTGQKLYPAGYRIYCTFMKECNNQSDVLRIHEKLKGIVGDRIANKIKSVFFFKIEAVREIHF